MTPLVAEMAALIPDIAADMVWFDMHEKWNSIREDYDHTLTIEGFQNPLPFPFCGIVMFDEFDNRVAIGVQEVDQPPRADGTTLEHKGWVIQALAKGKGTVNNYPRFFCDPKEQDIESGISILFEDKRHYDDERVIQSAKASLVAISFWLKHLNKEAVPTYRAAVKSNHAKRLRQGKKPLFEWTTVVLEPRRTKSASLGGTHATPRLHDVRGHWVMRGNKRFWRKPHKRGDASRGVIFKDYRITAQGPVVPLQEMNDVW